MRRQSPRHLTLILLCIVLVAAVGGCDQANTGGGPSLFNPGGANEEWWGIRCAVLTGPDRMQYAKAYAESLKKVQGLKADLVQVYHDPDASTIFYGRYAGIYSSTGGIDSYRPDNKREFELIRELTFEANGVVMRPFKAEMQPLPLTSKGRPEWNLENVAGFWSLQVGVFYNTPEMKQRRQAAEDYCKLLRDQGEEAYYHHGPARSSVCIGTFPYDAITQISEEDPMTGRVSVKSKIVNKKMLEIQKRFPTNLENGFVINNVARDSSGKVIARVPNASFPVELPRADRKARARQGK